MCSTAILGRQGRRILAFNFDYTLAQGLASFSVRGMSKENRTERTETSLAWKVAYRSVSFSSLCLEFPVAGINEAGLAASMMWHDGGDAGYSGNLPSLDPLHWVQYQLDTSAKVEDVLRSLNVVRPTSQGYPLHYVFLDQLGDIAIVEFAAGIPAVVRCPEVPVLTNGSYAPALDSWLTGVDPLEGERRTSLGRFSRLASSVKDYQREDVTPSEAFLLLESVRQGPTFSSDSSRTSASNINRTVWSIVLDPTTLIAHFRTCLNPAVRQLHGAELAAEDGAKVLVMNIHDGEHGNASYSLQEYRREDNESLVIPSAESLGLDKTLQSRLLAVVDELYHQGSA